MIKYLTACLLLISSSAFAQLTMEAGSGTKRPPLVQTPTLAKRLTVKSPQLKLHMMLTWRRKLLWRPRH